MRSMLKQSSAVRYAARRVIRWRQQDSAVILELEGVREPDAIGIAAVLAGAPLNDALDAATLTVTVLESGAVRLRLDAAGTAGAAAGAKPTDAALLDPAELEPAPVGVTTVSAPDDNTIASRLHLASERHGGLGPDPEDVTIEVTTDPFGLLIKDPGGRTVAELATTQPDETDDYRTAPLAWLRWTEDDGQRQQATTVALTLAPDERLSGLGERTGPLNLVGTDQTVMALGAAGTQGPATAPETDDPNARPPFLLSSSGYGLLVHTAAGLTAELGTHSPAAYTVAVPASSLDLLILPGSWPRTALATYARLTGRVAVPEPSAFGLTPGAPTDIKAATVNSGTDAAHTSGAPAAPTTVDEMRVLLRRGLSFGLTTPGLWRAPLGPTSQSATPAPITGSTSHDGQPSPLHQRWAQTALLCPLVSIDAGSASATGEPADGTPMARLLAAPAVQPYAALRQRLLPYLMHCARETAQSGLPMLRPLLLEFSWDAQAAAIDDQFLLGRDLLVAPVLSDSPAPVTCTVHLPQYANWYDWWTGAFYEGGRTIETTAPLDRLPLYVRAGTVIPLGPAGLPTSIGPESKDAPTDVTRLLLFAPHDGAIGASVELADDDLMGVEQERGEHKARVFMEGIPSTVRDIEIIGLPAIGLPAASVTLVDASATSIAIIPGDGSLPGPGGSWDSLTIRLDTGAFTAGLELGW
jgi:hypothetical protein